MKSHVGELGLAACLCLAAFSVLACADSFAPQRLFTLRYGSGPGQVGMRLPAGGEEEGPPAGPTDLAIGPDGSVYIADRVNKRIQRFSATGELLMEAKAPVERKAEHLAAYERGRGAEIPPRATELDNIQRIAVDSQGCVYVQFGAAIDRLAKFAGDGQARWYMHMADAVPLEVRQTYGTFYGGIVVGPEDSLCIAVSGRSVDGIAILDPDGRFLKAVNGYVGTPNGRIAAFTRVAGGALATAVRMYETDGVELASFVADPVATDPALFVGIDSFSGTAFDGMDNLYKFAIGVRDQRINLSSQLTIGCDEVAVRFDHSGRAAAAVRFPGDPFPTGRSSTIDYSGNVYRLAFGAGSVDIIKYVLDTSTSEYTSLRED